MSTQQGEAKDYILETAKDRLRFDQRTGRLVSFRSKTVPDQELLEVGKEDPVFVIQ